MCNMDIVFTVCTAEEFWYLTLFPPVMNLSSALSSAFVLRMPILQTLWTQDPGFIVFASMIKSSLKCTWVYAASVKSRWHFQVKLDFTRWYTITSTRFWSNQNICKVCNCYAELFRRRWIYKKVHYFTFDLDLRSRTNTKHCPVSSTSYDLCSCKVWSCYVQKFRRKCIYKKYLIWPLSKSHEALPSTSCVLCTKKVWSCYGPMVKEMHYKENTLYTRSKSQGHCKCCPVPSTSCDLCTNKVWCSYILWLRRRCI